MFASQADFIQNCMEAVCISELYLEQETIQCHVYQHLGQKKACNQGTQAL